MKGSTYTLRTTVLVVLIALIVVLFPLIAPNDYYVHLANMIGITFILTLGLNLLFGYAGQISVGHGAFYAIGAFTATLLMVKGGWPFWPSMLLAIIVSCMAGGILGVPSLRLKGFYLAMATLGFAVVVNVVLTQWESLTGGAGGISGVPRPSVFGYELNTEIKFYYLVLIIAFLSYIFIRNLLRSSVGRSLMALRDSESAAESMGINTTKYKVLVFVISSGLAGLAGALFASLSRYVTPDQFELMVSFILLGMVLIGGEASILGSLIAALLMILLPELTHVLGDYHLVAYSLLIILVILFLPSGVAGALFRFYKR